MSKNRVDIKKMFIGMQNEMLAILDKQKIIMHPGAKGDATELDWLDWFSKFFPKRYSFCKGFVIDHQGNLSDQIDIIVYDKQYSPLVFNEGGYCYVTAESVFAVFEVKQTLNKEYLLYAGAKAASVRRLLRTSAPIVYSTGIQPPKKPHRIIAGLLTTSSEWQGNNALTENLQTLSKEQEIDIICAIRRLACRVTYDRNDIVLMGKKQGELTVVDLDKNSDDGILIYLFLTLLMQLQIIGTVPAIEYDKYFGDVSKITEIFDDLQKSKKE